MQLLILYKKKKNKNLGSRVVTHKTAKIEMILGNVHISPSQTYACKGFVHSRSLDDRSRMDKSLKEKT